MRPLRPLLPVKREKPGSPLAEVPSKKRSTLACANCRDKRIKCDGARPACSSCRQRTSDCVYVESRYQQMKGKYEALQKQESDCQRFLALIKAGTEEHAVEVIRNLRAGRDVGAIVSQTNQRNTVTPYGLGRAAQPPATTSQQPASNRLNDYRTTAQLALEDSSRQRGDYVLIERAEMLQEVLDLLRCMPEDAAQSLLRELRSASEVTSVLQMVNGGTFEKQLSENRTARSLLPFPHSNLELELTVRHPVAHPALDHSQDSGLLQGLTGGLGDETSPDPWASDPIHDWEYPVDGSQSPKFQSLTFPELMSTDRNLADSNLGTNPYYDSRLSQLNIGFWTNVEVPNDFAAHAISAYLETDHPLFGFFNAGLFISDLVECRFEYCSAFLISSLLAFACIIHAAKDPKASTLSRSFEDEAEILWRVERRADTLPALAGMNFLLLSVGSHGKDKLAQQCIDDVADMSRRMNLFGVADKLTTADIACYLAGAQIATAQTAWASYNHLCQYFT